MFGRRRRLDNAAAMPVPLPRQQPIQVTHQNTPNWVGIILAGFAVVVIGAIVLWHFAVYLADAAGSRAPERDISIGLFWLFIIAAATGIIYFGFVALIAMIGDVARDITKTIVDGRVQVAQAAQLAAIASVPAGRATEAQHHFAQVVILVMNEAYRIVRDEGGFKGTKRPWSRRGAKEIADNARKDVPETGTLSCESISPFLRRRDVITGNEQINFSKFPDIASIKALLEREFNIPVKTASLSPISELIGYEHIDQAN